MTIPVTVARVGGQMRIIMSDATELVAVPTGYGYWVVTSDVDAPTPEPGGYRWPFDRSEHTTYANHSGIDWAEATGTPIRAVGPGVVQAVYAYAGNTYPDNSSEPIWRGNCVVVNHGTIAGVTIWTLYAHMRSAPTVAVGDPVAGGAVLGEVGNTGFSNGVHLHFEVIFNGQRLTTSMGGGAERTLGWMDANANGVW